MFLRHFVLHHGLILSLLIAAAGALWILYLHILTRVVFHVIHISNELNFNNYNSTLPPPLNANSRQVYLSPKPGHSNELARQTPLPNRGHQVRGGLPS